MRVAVTGATGNVGVSVLGALSALDEVTEIVGIARRKPDTTMNKVTWLAADVVDGDLDEAFAGVDAVIHLAWALQPSHRREQLRAINVGGSRRVFTAAGKAGVKKVIMASSLAAYSPGPKDRTVDESWPTDGIKTSHYSNDKVEVERMLDTFEVAYPKTTWIRMRPTLVIKREVGPELHGIFLGRLVPRRLFNNGSLPVSPKIDGLAFQAVHGSDVGNAFAAALIKDVKGAFNLASDPVIDNEVLARVLDGKKLPIPGKLARLAADVSWRLRLQPTDPGWVDILLQTPLLDSGRARKELDWEPKISASDALKDVLEGMGQGKGLATPPLKT